MYFPKLFFVSLLTQDCGKKLVKNFSMLTTMKEEQEEIEETKHRKIELEKE